MQKPYLLGRFINSRSRAKLQNPLKKISYPGKIHLITSDQHLEMLSEKISAAAILGFDTETRPSFAKGEFHKVALLQLATHEEAYLIRLHTITNFEFIKFILECEKIVKVGAAIHDDLKALQKQFKFTPKNFVEIQSLAKQKGVKNMGLKGMTEEVLNAALSKAAKITNWEATELTEAQILYAATDAWISLRLLEVLNTR